MEPLCPNKFVILPLTYLLFSTWDNATQRRRKKGFLSSLIHMNFTPRFKSKSAFAAHEVRSHGIDLRESNVCKQNKIMAPGYLLCKFRDDRIIGFVWWVSLPHPTEQSLPLKRNIVVLFPRVFELLVLQATEGFGDAAAG